MQKLIIILILILLSIVNVDAFIQDPHYEIVSNSNAQNDIKEIYAIKKSLLKDFKEWSISVDSVDQVLYDHTSDYHATYENGIYKIVIGKGKGKTLKGVLKTNYCESTHEIKKKSILKEWFSFF